MSHDRNRTDTLHILPVKLHDSLALTDLLMVLCYGYVTAPVRFFTQNEAETRRETAGFEPALLA